MGSLPLHKTKGINPHMTICSRCGEDGRDILLLGVHDKKWRCSSCDTINLSAGMPRECGSCKSRCGFTSEGEVGEFEKLVTGLCDKCAKDLKEFDKIVSEGGIYWRCKDCSATGVIRGDSPFAKAVRKEMGIAAPKPAGVEFSNKDCPSCGPNAVKGDASEADADAGG